MGLRQVFRELGCLSRVFLSVFVGFKDGWLFWELNRTSQKGRNKLTHKQDKLAVSSHSKNRKVEVTEGTRRPTNLDEVSSKQPSSIDNPIEKTAT